MMKNIKQQTKKIKKEKVKNKIIDKTLSTSNHPTNDSTLPSRFTNSANLTSNFFSPKDSIKSNQLSKVLLNQNRIKSNSSNLKQSSQTNFDSSSYNLLKHLFNYFKPLSSRHQHSKLRIPDYHDNHEEQGDHYLDWLVNTRHTLRTVFTNCLENPTDRTVLITEYGLVEYIVNVMMDTLDSYLNYLNRYIKLRINNNNYYYHYHRLQNETKFSLLLDYRFIWNLLQLQHVAIKLLSTLFYEYNYNNETKTIIIEQQFNQQKYFNNILEPKVPIVCPLLIR